MPERAMELQTDPVLALVYEPRAGEDFQRVKIAIPKRLADSTAENDFHDICNDHIWEACGATACRAALLLSSLEDRTDDSRLILGADIYCNKAGCPLDSPGGSGDREPRKPHPPKPALQAGVSQPASI